MKKHSIETLLYSVAGVGILLVVLVAFNALMASFKGRLDLTQDKNYSLSEGTRQILAKLDAPVKIRFYDYAGESGGPETVALKTYAQHVRDLLDEYRQAARGKIKVEYYEPKPDSDAEDSAKLDGLEGQMLSNGERVYFGLSVSLLDSKQAIPFLDPERDRLLEYELSRAISQVVTPDKPVVGIMSPLPVFGNPVNPMLARMGQQGQEPWVFVKELQADYAVRQVDMTADKIDDDIKVLIVIHPKDITDQTQYALDQFIMRGGRLIAFLGALSIADSHSQNPMMGPMPGGGSTLDKLLQAWGIRFDDTKVAADVNYKQMAGGRNGQPKDYLGFLTVSGSGINADDSATSELHDLGIPFSGAFTGTPVPELKETVLVKTTKDSQLVESMPAALGADDVLRDFKPSGIEYPLAIRLTGRFKTAFPDGKPKDPAKDTAKNPAAADKKEEPKAPDDSIKECKGDNVVVLFGNSDMISDQFAIRQSPGILGMMGQIELRNGNLILAQNVVEQSAGDSRLIGLRSRASANRPFTRIREMESKANQMYQSKIKEFEDQERDTQQKIADLQHTKDESQQRFVLSPEQQKELENLKRQAAKTNADLKQLRKDLAREKDSLQNELKWGNIVGMPLLVALTGLCLAAFKRNRTSAR